jgi:hypothetical protein
MWSLKTLNSQKQDDGDQRPRGWKRGREKWGVFNQRVQSFQ